MNKVLFLASVISFVFASSSLHFAYAYDLHSEEYEYVLSDDEANIEGLDTTTVCVVQNDTINIQWINGFPVQGTLKKPDGTISQINYPTSSFLHVNNPYPVSALAAPMIYSNNSVGIMLMSGTGTLKMIDIKTGNVALEEFIPTVAPEIELECINPPEEREKIKSSGMHPYGLPTGREVPHVVNYNHLPAGAYFMVILNQNNEVFLVKTIYKDIN